jgi:hypothetical protein
MIFSENGVPPPGAIISARKMLDDPRAEPQYGERVPYVVRTGAPGARLIDRVVSPEEMLKDRFTYPVEALLIDPVTCDLMQSIISPKPSYLPLKEYSIWWGPTFAVGMKICPRCNEKIVRNF